MGDVIFRMSADEGKAVQGFLKLNDAQKKVEEGFKRTGRASRDAGGHINRSMSSATREAGRFIGAVTGIGGAVGAVAAVAAQLRRELENLQQRQKAAADLQRSVADIRAEVMFNKPGDISAQRVDELVGRLSSQYQVPPQRMYGAVGGLLSAKGGLAWPTFAGGMEQVARLGQVGGPNMDLQTLGGAMLDIMRVTGGTDAGGAYGWLRQFGAASRIVSPQKQARALPPVISAAGGYDWTPEQAAELLAYLTQASGDVMGESSMTGAITFMGNLQKARTQAGALIPQRIGDKIMYRPLQKRGPAALKELQDWAATAPADLRDLLWAKLPGEAKVKGGLQGLIAREPGAIAGYEAAQRAISAPGAPGVGAVGEEYFKAVAAGRGEPVRAVGWAGQSYVEQMQLTSPEAMAGAVRAEAEKVLTATPGIGAFDRRMGMWKTNITTNFGRRDPVEGYIELLRGYQGEFQSGQRMGRMAEMSGEEMVMLGLSRRGPRPMEPTERGLDIAERLGKVIDRWERVVERMDQATDPAGGYVVSPEGGQYSPAR